jgi:hypothetical protein
MSWEDPPYSGDEYIELCEKSSPSDFYFAVRGDMEIVDVTMVALVPKVYFHKHGCMWDQHISVESILPDDLFEAMESVWETERDAEDVRKDLLARGFEENDKFNQLMSEYYD